MNRLIASTKKRYFVFTAALIALLFFMVFLPVVKQLKAQVKENYKILADSKKQTIVELINSSLANTRSISSRTAIKDYILQYNDGQITWSTLQLRSFNKYRDGLTTISNLDLSIRYVSDRVLLTYNPANIDVNQYINTFEQSKKLQYRFASSEDSTKIAVCSPIVDKGALLGHDIIVIDITEQIREMSKDGFNVKIVQVNNPLIKHMTPNVIYERFSIDEIDYMCIMKPINQHYSLFVTKPTDEVFHSSSRVSAYSIVGFFGGLMLIFFVINIGLLKSANAVIHEIGNSRDTYMQYAHYDFVTGAYTRVFFDNWIKDNAERFKERKYFVAMIDVDYFKKINDTFGHKTGDDVLKFIADSIISTIRKNDMVIRFGGDEFIVVFEGVNEEKVLKIFDRIEKHIHCDNGFGFKIRISYGMQEAESLADIYESIKKADEKMYSHKKSKLDARPAEDEFWQDSQ